MSYDEQHEASKRAAKHRGHAEDIAEWAFHDEVKPKPTDIQMACGMAAIVHLLLAIEDRLNYGGQSVLEGTISCRICRTILLEENTDGHYDWHTKAGQYPA